MILQTIFPIIIIPIIILIFITNKRAEIKIDTNKHTRIRIYVLVIAIILIFSICQIIYGIDGILNSFFLSYYFFGAWLFYLLLETISLYITKKNKLAQASLSLLVLSALFVAMGTFVYFNSLH